jgi:hypothetical protein
MFVIIRGERGRMERGREVVEGGLHSVPQLQVIQACDVMMLGALSSL